MPAEDEPVRERGRDASPPELPPWIEIEPGERVLFHELVDRRARLGSYVATLGLFEVWRRRSHFIVTNRRLMAVRGLVSRDQQSIPLTRIDKLTPLAHGWWVTVDVSTVGGLLGTQPFGPMSRRQAQALIRAVEHGLEVPMGQPD
jgi:hypothetical protein